MSVTELSYTVCYSLIYCLPTQIHKLVESQENLLKLPIKEHFKLISQRSF